ncbi:MAG: hypothetical protein Kow0090_21070 [Myxococcota bacterium]
MRRPIPFIYFMLLIAGFLSLSASFCTEDFREEKPKTDAPEKRIAAKDVKGPLAMRSISYIEMANKHPYDMFAYFVASRIPAGVEFGDIAKYSPTGGVISLVMKKTALKDLMQVIIEKDSSYDWDLVSNVVIYAPKESLTNSLHPLNREISLEIKDKTLPEAISILNGHLEKERIPVAIISEPSLLPSEKFSITDKPRPLRNYLNRLVLKARKANWMAFPLGNYIWIHITGWGKEVYIAKPISFDSSPSKTVADELSNPELNKKLGECLRESPVKPEFLPLIASLSLRTDESGKLNYSDISLAPLDPGGIAPCLKRHLESFSLKSLKKESAIKYRLALLKMETAQEDKK